LEDEVADGITVDLVRRLREEADCYRGKTQSCLTDAADRIERLEAALREIVEKTRDAHAMSYVADYFRIARAALAGEKKDE
jgi:hypothetical protein